VFQTEKIELGLIARDREAIFIARWGHQSSFFHANS